MPTQFKVTAHRGKAMVYDPVKGKRLTAPDCRDLLTEQQARIAALEAENEELQLNLDDTILSWGSTLDGANLGKPFVPEAATLVGRTVQLMVGYRHLRAQLAEAERREEAAFRAGYETGEGYGSDPDEAWLAYKDRPTQEGSA